ncbi:MAG: hypothetical protein AB1393_12265 [Candidatus Edwardsbacteria bacterium]
MNVKKMVVGSIGRLGEKYKLFLRVVNVETARIEEEDKEEGVVKVEELDRLVPPLVNRLAPKVGW